MDRDKSLDAEFSLRIALNHVVGGACFLEMDMPVVVSILRSVADDFEEEWKNNLP